MIEDKPHANNSVPCREQELFQQLAFCWEFFEKDGLNAEIVEDYVCSISEPILVVGSGQGIVSKRLLEHFTEVRSIDALPEMARYAKERRGVDTDVVDFLDMDSNETYSSIVINTGVISSRFSGGGWFHLARQLFANLSTNGVVILALFERTSFDDYIEAISLHSSREKIKKIWIELEKGKDIVGALSEIKVAGVCNEYYSLLFRDELGEYEQQIRNASRQYKEKYPLGNVSEFISNCMRYVSYGLDFNQQKELMASMSMSGFDVDCVNRYKDLTVVTLVKK